MAKAMTNRKLALGIGVGYQDSFENTVKFTKSAGFDGCFTGCNRDGSDIAEMAETIAKNGLIYQSVHSPFTKVHHLWEEGEEGEHQTDLLISCLNACQRSDVPIMIVHPIIGMDRHTPNDLGIKRFARLVEAAEKTNVMLAFENVENLEYLDKIFSDLGNSSSVGLCWDTGHEMCYNFNTDIPGRFPGKLIATHFNDNLGITDPANVTWHDDAHLLPTDGIADWAGIMRRIERENYSGIITFEITRNNKPDRHTHDIYDGLDHEAFIALAYEKACKVVSM